MSGLPRVSCCLLHSASIDPYPVCISHAHSKLDVVRSLIDGPDGAALLTRKAMADTGTALHFAALNGHVDVVRYLLG